MGATIPDKLFYKIGEVARIADVKTSVLRFWETEFDFLKPDKSSTGQRLYTRKEVELVLQVRRLLYEDKFTIEGVKKQITSRGRIQGRASVEPKKQELAVSKSHIDLLRLVREELKLIRNQLGEYGA